MVKSNNQLQSLRESDTDVARILDVCDEIDRVYKAALEAMGLGSSQCDVVKNSANVTISFQPSESAHTLTVR